MTSSRSVVGKRSAGSGGPMSANVNSHFSATANVAWKASFTAGPEFFEGHHLLVRSEDPELAAEAVPFGRVGNLLVEGVEQDKALGAFDELERVGPDEGQVVRPGEVLGPLEVEEIGADVEVVRG